MNFFLDPQNLALIAVALVSGGLLAWPAIRRGSGDAALSPLQATQLFNQKNAGVIDVREPAEFAAGSLTGAKNIPLGALADRMAELTRYKNRPLIVVCQSGQRSSRAVTQLKKEGYAEVYNLAGGVGAWQQAGLPLVKARESGQPAGKDKGK